MSEMRFFAMVGLAWLLGSCEYRQPEATLLGYELYDQYCNDGIDNDGDGLIDCDDPECPFTSPWCGENYGLAPPPEGPEDSVYLCADRFDNDGNGQFDCGDDKCQAIAETCCLRELDDASCSDGLDNDGNGFRDCQDFGCSRSNYVTVCDAETRGRETPALACSDGRDNDGDDLVDCADADCQNVPLPDGSTCPTLEPESSVEACSDGRDNDGNGFADCRDRGCSRANDSAVRQLCCPGGDPSGNEGAAGTCDDGIDNDCNSFLDCDDFACSDDPACAPDPGAEPENTFERCRDGVDNDDNGFLDCADFSCSRPGDEDLARDPQLAFACDETGGFQAGDQATAVAACSDGEDNDDDGFVDCDDFNCNYNPFTSGICREARGRLICE